MILKNPDGSRTYYQAFGNATNSTLLLLHGIGADHAMWQPQMDFFTAAGFHVLVPDLFGHGRSSKCNLKLDYADLSAWHYQINWLLDHCKVNKCTLIGVSMGGVFAQSFVVSYPQRVERLVVADSFGELRTLQERMMGFAAIAGFTLFKRLGRNLMIKGLRATYSTPYTQAAQDYFVAVSTRLDFDQLLLIRKAINRIDVLEDLKDIAIPALVVVGEDFGQGFIEINRKIAAALPNAKFVTLERAMDPSNLVNPIGFNQCVLKFLRQNPPA